ncbi:DEAD/DEAH box helicase [Micromonospora sp. BRA006-A]|nr:DEAD/DEAH box helicase [Micromonospora sp. BRA006-A]
MRAVMKRRDALVVLPTGAGKSAIYQIPASLIPGPTVVISPLLALQQDQIAALNGRQRPGCARYGSARTRRRPAGRGDRGHPCRAREFLFITPEALSSPDRLAEVRELKPALVAIDEAHCTPRGATTSGRTTWRSVT